MATWSASAVRDDLSGDTPAEPAPGLAARPGSLPGAAPVEAEPASPPGAGPWPEREPIPSGTAEPVATPGPVTDPDPKERPLPTAAHDLADDPGHDPADDPGHDPAHGPAHDPAAPERPAHLSEQASPVTREQGPTVPLRPPAPREAPARSFRPAEPGDVPVWPPRLPGETAPAPDAPLSGARAAWPPDESAAPDAPGAAARADATERGSAAPGEDPEGEHSDDHSRPPADADTGDPADGESFRPQPPEASGEPPLARPLPGVSDLTPPSQSEAVGPRQSGTAYDSGPDQDSGSLNGHGQADGTPGPRQPVGLQAEAAGHQHLPARSGPASPPMPVTPSPSPVLLAPEQGRPPGDLPVPFVPPAAPPARRSSGTGKKILLGAGTGIVVVAIGAAAYLAYTGQPEDASAAGAPPTTSGAPAATTPAAQPSTSTNASGGTNVNAAAPLDSEETDPRKLTLAETFPDARITLAGRSFKRVKVSMTDSCEQAAAGTFADALKQQECRRVLRATYVDAKQHYAVTTGIAVLPTKDAALAVDKAKNLSGNLWFRGLNGDTGSGAERVAISGGYAAGMVWGRYIVFSYATYADGHTPGAKEQDLGPVSGAFRDHTAEVIGKRVTG